MVGAEDLGLGSRCKSKKHKLVIYDTETNGEWPEQRVIELAAYSVETGQKFSTLINSNCEVQDIFYPSVLACFMYDSCTWYGSCMLEDHQDALLQTQNMKAIPLA